MRNGKKNIQRFLLRIKRVRKRLGGRRRIGIRDIENQTIGENTGGIGDRKIPGRQSFLVDLQARESPGGEAQRLHLELQSALNETILRLKILRTQERALPPDDRLQTFHRTPQ